MKSITVRNYRCFGDTEQIAQLAPLTLLVGENSSGKTSLMALIRALWDVSIDDRIPDFKEPPYDLGSFNEIAHHRGARGSRAESFEGRFELEGPRQARRSTVPPIEFNTTFGEQWSAPIPVRRGLVCDGYRVTQYLSEDEYRRVEIESPRGHWLLDLRRRRVGHSVGRPAASMWPIDNALFSIRAALDREQNIIDVKAVDSSPDITSDDITEIMKLADYISLRMRRRVRYQDERPFATAPVRSEPQRTYDPWRSAADALGDYVPTYLAQLSQRDKVTWDSLKSRLEKFGSDAGLFDEIRVRQLGKTDADPFQVQVRKFGPRSKGPFRSLVDVGYGISQVLPVAAELLRDDAPRILLLQQPEVHLHPSAQASLGTLLCEVATHERASHRRQLIVETHSDYIIDRVRMAVADPQNLIGPDDVSLVYFERAGLEVFLHSLSIDELGNFAGAPSGYRQFFLDEIQRSLAF